MSNIIFSKSGDSLLEMPISAYQKELELQKIVADNPGILQRENDDVSIFLVAQEYKISDAPDSDISFYIDHLCIDSNGVPIIVETKLGHNTEIRRTITGQMLDYASRISIADLENIKSLFRANNNQETVDQYDTQDFWESVAVNISAARMKLVFVADRIPSSLSCLIEFMSRVMQGIDVYGIELTKYDGNLFTKRTVENIEKTVSRRQSLPPRTWNKDDFLTQVKDLAGDTAANTAREIIRFCETTSLSCGYGTGRKIGSFIPRKNGYILFAVKPLHQFSCGIEFYEPHLMKSCSGKISMSDLMEKLIQLKGQRSSDEISRTDMYIFFDISVLNTQENMKIFQEIIKELIEL